VKKRKNQIISDGKRISPRKNFLLFLDYCFYPVFKSRRTNTSLNCDQWGFAVFSATMSIN
jgi:hypothetical protein